MFQDWDSKSKSTDDHISLMVLNGDANGVQFKIRKETPLIKLMNAYCKTCNLDLNLLRFRFDGDCVSKLDTPKKMKMEDGDVLEIFQEQEGSGLQSNLQTSKT
uniref:Small ubiquitin-related modifier 3 n=1 Tax=Cacopsylla melanoneura TaxID=428564 RepID=A0A8D9EB76_9HEMI